MHSEHADIILHCSFQLKEFSLWSWNCVFDCIWVLKNRVFDCALTEVKYECRCWIDVCKMLEYMCWWDCSCNCLLLWVFFHYNWALKVTAICKCCCNYLVLEQKAFLLTWSLAFPVVKWGLILLRCIIILESNCVNVAEKQPSTGVSLRSSGIFHKLEQLVYISYLCMCVCIYTCRCTHLFLLLSHLYTHGGKHWPECTCHSTGT